MNTINDKGYNVAFGLNMKKETLELFSKKAKLLIKNYEAPIAVKKNGIIVQAQSPQEHISALRSDIATDKFTAEIETHPGNTYEYSLKYKFTNPNNYQKNIGTSVHYYKSITDVLKSMTEESISNMRMELNKQVQKLLNLKRNTDKINLILKERGIEKIFETDAASKIVLSGIKPAALRKIVNSFPEHFKFNAVRTRSMGNSCKLEVSSTKYPAAPPIIIGEELNPETKTLLSKKAIVKLENETLKPLHEKFAAIYEAKLQFKNLFEEIYKDPHVYNSGKIPVKKPEYPGLNFSDDMKEMILKSETITPEQIGKFVELAKNPNAQNLRLMVTDSPKKLFLIAEYPNYYTNFIHIDSSELGRLVDYDSNSFYQILLKKLENIDEIAAKEKQIYEDSQNEILAKQTAAQRTKNAIEPITRSEAFRAKFPPLDNGSYPSRYAVEETEEYTPELINTLINETPGLEFKIENTNIKNTIGFFVKSEKYPKAGFQELFSYPEHIFIDAEGKPSFDLKDTINRNLTIENIRYFEEIKLKAVEKENIAIENFRNSLKESFPIRKRGN